MTSNKAIFYCIRLNINSWPRSIKSQAFFQELRCPLEQHRSQYRFQLNSQRTRAANSNARINKISEGLCTPNEDANRAETEPYNIRKRVTQAQGQFFNGASRLILVVWQFPFKSRSNGRTSNYLTQAVKLGTRIRFRARVSIFVYTYTHCPASFLPVTRTAGKMRPKTGKPARKE